MAPETVLRHKHRLLHGAQVGWLPDAIQSRLIFSEKGIRPSHFQQHLEQADVCPMMAALLGIPTPVNNVGRLPIQLLQRWCFFYVYYQRK
jgi:hypothetical protein